MPPKSFIESQTIRIAVYALVLGTAWATLQAQVSGKAQQADVVAIQRDLADIRVLLCRHEPTDSYCKHQ